MARDDVTQTTDLQNGNVVLARQLYKARGSYRHRALMDGPIIHNEGINAEARNTAAGAAHSCARRDDHHHAIFLTSFVLVTQNRMQADADQRADLDLQISLLIEHELTRLVSLVRQIAERTGVELPSDPDFQAIERDVEPATVLDALERKKARASGKRLADLTRTFGA